MGKSVLSRNGGGVVVGQSSYATGKNSVSYGNTASVAKLQLRWAILRLQQVKNAVAWWSYSFSAAGKNSVSIGSIWKTSKK